MLSVKTLQDGIKTIIDPKSPDFPKDYVTGAQGWAKVYHQYAQQAQDASGDSLLVSAPDIFESVLENGLKSSVTAETAAMVFDQAFVGYWTLAQFNITKPVPPGTPGTVGGNTIFSQEILSSVTLVIPTTLSSLILPVFQDLVTQDIESRSLNLASAIHLATTIGIQITIAGIDTTVPVPLPITNISGMK